MKYYVVGKQGNPARIGLAYDLDALVHNARFCAALAARHSYSLRVVLKGGYVAPEIVDCLAGINGISFAVGYAKDALLPALKRMSVATVYPSHASVGQVPNNINRNTEVSLSGLALLACRCERRRALVAIGTSEGREGADLEGFRDLVRNARTEFGDRISIDGFQLNYGCVRAEPPATENVNRLLNDLAKEISSCSVANPILSLGGSVLLPMLKDITIPDSFRAELRIGEAILAGTVPGQTASFGLCRTASYHACRLQTLRRSEESRERSLIDVGSYILDPMKKVRVMEALVVESLGSEVSVVSHRYGEMSSSNAQIKLRLDYAETERALTRCRGIFRNFLTSSPAILAQASSLLDVDIPNA